VEFLLLFNTDKLHFLIEDYKTKKEEVQAMTVFTAGDTA
jgi:hypothetical protein